MKGRDRERRAPNKVECFALVREMCREIFMVVKLNIKFKYVYTGNPVGIDPVGNPSKLTQ